MTRTLHIASGLLAGISLLCLNGCAHFHDQPLSLDGVQADFSGRTLADAGLQSFIARNLQQPAVASPGAPWDVAKLSLAAFYFHPDLDVARAQLAGAKAAGVTAGERPNPTLNLAPAYDTTTGPPWILGLSLDIPIETAGKRRYRIAQATHLSDAARYQLAAAAWQVRSRVRRTLLALFAAKEVQTLLAEQERLQAESVQLLTAQLQAGAISPFEVTQSRVALNQTRFALRDAEKAEATTRVQLSEALGVPLIALDGVNLSFEDFIRFPTDIPDATARRQALANRSDILAALAAYAATQSALQLEVAKQYPDIHLGPGYQRDQRDDKWSLGLTVALPVLNHNQGPIAEAEARRGESAARFNVLQARVLSEIEQAVAGYRASVQKVESAQALNGEISAQLRTAQGMLGAGEISRVELAQRQLELTNAALAQLDALIKTQESLSALEDALQSPAATVVVSEASPRTGQVIPTISPRPTPTD